MTAKPDDYDARLKLAVNTYTERRLSAMRQSMAYGSGFNDTTDTKRPKVWADFGFPNSLNFYDYLNLYTRNSLAHAIVHRISEKTWADEPWLVEGDQTDNKDAETRWERDTRKLFKKLGVWQKFQDADRRRLVGMYSGLILQVADDGRWDQELGQGELVGIIPAWQGQLTPTMWNNDTTSPNYGQPTMWQYQEADVETADHPPPGRSVNIHHSRVVIVGDYREGVPLLEAPYNDFVSLEKVTGALGESYWKNAARQINVEYDKETDPAQLAAAAGVDVEDLHEALTGMFSDLNQGLDAGMVTFGGKATPLVASVPPPMEPADVLRQNICASAMIPLKIAIGNQSGERASSEDNDDFNARCQSRRLGVVMSDVRRLVDRLTEYRIIDPVGEYQVMWTDLTEAGLSAKLDNAVKMSEINRNLMGTGERAYDADDIREVTGHEALDLDDNVPDNLDDED